MADVDTLPSRGIRTAALVDGNGIATNGSQTVAQLAARGMNSICAVDATGVSVSGATMLQLGQRGIRSFCPVDELGVSQGGATADALRRAGIRPMVLLDNTGTALNGSAKTLTLAQRGLSCFCPLDEAGNATTMGAVILVSNTSVLESATIGTTVGTLSVAGGTGTYTFTLTNTAGGKFTTAGTNGVNLNTAGALDYETATSHTITVSATNGGTPITRTIVIAVLNVVEDTTPDAFTFTDVTGAALSTVTESNSITVAGIDGPATMTITGGEYSVNGGAYASVSTSVVAGATVKVRGTSSALNSTAVNVTLTIGGVSDTFTITTLSSGGTTLTLAWTSANTVYDPVFTLTFYTAVVGDVLTLQIDDNSDFSSLYTSASDTLDSSETAAGTITYAGITTLLPGVTYYARVKMTRAAVDTYSNTVSQTMYIDSVAPTVVSYSPVDNATGVAVGVELVVTFSETIVMGTGTISLKKTSDNSTIDSWNVATAGGSTAGKVEIIGGTTLHIHLTSSLALGVEYYVVWPAGVVKDTAGNNVAAQSSTTLWSFTTTSVAAPNWTATAAPAVLDMGFAPSPAVFSSVAINNTATSDVIIVFVGSSYQHVTGVTIDDGGGQVAMTLVADSDSSVNSGQIWKLTGHVYTTVTVRVSSTSNLAYVAITAGYLSGVNYAQVSTATKPGGYGPDPQQTTSALAVPAGGRGLGILFYATDPTVVWNTGVKDYQISAGVGLSFAITTGYYTVAATPTFTIGTSNYAAIAAAAWGP